MVLASNLSLVVPETPASTCSLGRTHAVPAPRGAIRPLSCATGVESGSVLSFATGAGVVCSHETAANPESAPVATVPTVLSAVNAHLCTAPPRG
jgi:hypothetical protein